MTNWAKEVSCWPFAACDASTAQSRSEVVFWDWVWRLIQWVCSADDGLVVCLLVWDCYASFEFTLRCFDLTFLLCQR